MNENESMIEVNSLSKKYDGFTALNEVSLKITKGTIFGLLGSNGAGKSTLIRILSGQSRPSSGSAYISSLDIVEDKKHVLSIIGVVPQENSFYDELTVNENLTYFGLLYGAPYIEIKKRSKRILELLQLTEKKDSKASTLSGGMKTRLNVACALIHKPQMLIMDEPSVGLDPVSRRALWETIRELNQEGTTILITTHYMEEADELCDWITIMHRGRVIVEGLPEELKGKIGEHVIHITSTPGNYQEIKTKLESMKGVTSSKVTEKGLKFTIRDELILQSIIEIFDSFNEKIVDVSSSKPSLEDVFIHFTGEEWH